MDKKTLPGGQWTFDDRTRKHLKSPEEHTILLHLSTFLDALWACPLPVCGDGQTWKGLSAPDRKLRATT